MRQNAYKDILNFLKGVHGHQVKGHSLRRLHQVSSMVYGCMITKRCTVEGLSQSINSLSPKKKDSLIQQSKRFLKNKWIDWQVCYLPFIVHFLQRAACQGELVFIIDGSQFGSTHTCLMVSVLYKNFSIPVVWVVKKGEKGHFPELLHIQVLRLLIQCIPSNCRNVLLGDGEFDGEELRTFCKKHHFE